MANQLKPLERKVQAVEVKLFNYSYTAGHPFWLTITDGFESAQVSLTLEEAKKVRENLDKLIKRAEKKAKKTKKKEAK